MSKRSFQLANRTRRICSCCGLAEQIPPSLLAGWWKRPLVTRQSEWHPIR